MSDTSDTEDFSRIANGNISYDSTMSDDDVQGSTCSHQSTSNSNRLPLIPSDCDDIQEANENFLRVFESRYGDRHPLFTPISLAEAVGDLQKCSFKVRKPVLIYLHDDNSVLSQIFCSQVLCAPALIDFINSNFIFLTWDFTLAENRAKFIGWFEALTGPHQSFRLRACTCDEFPVLVVVGKVAGSVDIMNIIKGAHLIEPVLHQLFSVVDHCNQQIQIEAAEETERINRELVRIEQDEAFKASLAADQEKARIKDELEKLQKEQEKRQLAFEKRREEERIIAESSLQPEPPENTQQPFTTLRIRAIGSKNFERRFLLAEPVTHLLHYVTSKSFSPDEYKILTSFPPKTDLSTVDPKCTFGDLKFGPREMIVIEAR